MKRNSTVEIAHVSENCAGDIPKHCLQNNDLEDVELCEQNDHANEKDYHEHGSDDELHEDMSKWLLIQDSDSDSDNEQPNGFGKGCTRVRALDDRPEFQRLKSLRLSVRPQGCMLGIHPAARVWRAASETSSCFSRSFDGSSNRTAWPALLRVFELMLESYVTSNAKDKLAKNQLSRIRDLRSQEPTHKD